MKSSTNTIVNHANSMEQGIILIQQKFTELDHESSKQAILIDELISEKSN